MAGDGDGDAAKRVFAGCRFAFIVSRTLSSTVIAEYSTAVQNNGAEVLEPEEDGRYLIGDATHIIANSIDFEDFAEADALMRPVVTTSWIQYSLSKNKQVPLRPFSPDPRLIFSQVNLTFADIPSTDIRTLSGACMAMGGLISKDVTKATTHICALSMDHDKCKIVAEKGLKCKIVLPHWFDDCFKLGKRIDEGPYVLPGLEVLNKEPEEPMEIPSSQHLEGAVTTRPDAMPATEEKSSRGALTVFQGKRVLLSFDLALTARFSNIITEMIQSGGGQLANEVEECDMFICQYRDGPQYIKAAQHGKDVGSLAWLFYLITHNEWCSPFRRLLHYPVPRDGIPGFKDLKITLSNYGGEARVYLENLITAAGATYTKTMKAENTHLITARENSEKCQAAMEWNVSMVNHLWIEESYAKCQAQTLAKPKYTTWPRRTNLGEIIGQTFLEEPKLRATYYPGGEDEMDEVANYKRQVLEAANDNAYPVGPALAAASSKSPGASELAVFNDEDLKGVGRSKHNPRKLATPARGRHVRLGKENDTPSIMSSGSRSAKDKAISRLHGLAPDLALYDKEKKRASKGGHGPWGGKRAADQFERDRASAKSSSPGPGRSEGEDDDDGEETTVKRPTKKQKTALPNVDIKIMLTGFSRWIQNPNKEDAERKKLRSLGIQIVQDNQPCEYLAAPAVVRTAKFLKTLSKGAQVINCKYIDDVLDGGKLLAPEDYTLKDKTFEKKHGEPLQKSIARARANRGRLLWGVPIYCTEGIRNGPDSYKAVAEANGAIFKIYRARSGTTIRPTSAEEDGGAKPEPVYLLSCNTAAERALWPKFEKMAIDGHMEPRVVAPDWLLEAALKQKVAFNKDYLATNFWA